MSSEEAMQCKVCGGALTLLGALGSLFHYRCRDCGMEQSSKEGPPEEDQTVDDDERAG